MIKVTANKFLDLVRRSSLVDEARLASFLEKSTATHGEAVLEDQNRLAELMIAANLLTRWQADKLLGGKHKGFRLGKYKLLGQIGKGGMSSVYLAEHELMRRRVAIKVLPQSRVGDSSYLERFRLEARAVAKLDDPNIVRAYDIDNEGDIHYIVMEYVDGLDLHQLVSQEGPLDFDAAADYIVQVASGLQHAHEMGLVHRDIKPANCLLDRNQTVKLLDLGLAKLTEDDQASLTMANEENVLGTADYLAPEQALNSHRADARSDIYSLGCTLYFLLTGGPPFPEGSISERLLKHQTQRPESIYHARPDAPPSLVDLCDQMMAKLPGERPQSAGEVAARLTEWLADRGRKVGGGKLPDGKRDSGVGSGVFRRFSKSAAPPAKGSSVNSRTVSVSDRDTKKLDDKGSGVEEEIGLAPLDDEDVLSVHGRRKPEKPKKESDSKPVTGSNVTTKAQAAASSDVALRDSGKGSRGPGKGKSLIEEEFSDPEKERPHRKLAQRLEYNPLHPPGYSSAKESRGPSLVVWVGSVAIVLAIILLIVVVVNSTF